MARNYRNYKRTAQEELGDRGLDAPNPHDIVIPDAFHQAFVIYDQLIGPGRMFIFASEFGLEMLANHTEQIAVDGTFKVNDLFSFICLIELEQRQFF
jgi:hypothetical protein